MAKKLDRTDLRILKTLQGNGRITNLQLSQEIGLSPAPTLERVRKLERANLITGYHAAVNQRKLGLGIKALIQVSLSRQLGNANETFIQQINNVSEVVECHQVTGNFDYQMMIIVEDIPAFDTLINNTLSKIESIALIQTSVVLSTVKDSKIVPLNYNGNGRTF